MKNDFSYCLKEFAPVAGRTAQFFALAELEKLGFSVCRLPVSLRVVLESLLRNCDGQRVRKEDVLALAGWQPNDVRSAEVPFVVSRILLQDFTGVPLLVDLAAMRSAVQRRNQDVGRVEPLVPVDLVIDHSSQVNYFGTPQAFEQNLENEFRFNQARYEFLRWGTQAFKKLRIVPPGMGICHQVNLEYLAQGVWETNGVFYPDSLVGTDSHTTMINGLGVVGWGVGGIEAEAGMLGQPISFLMPDVVGVHLGGSLSQGVTATDAVLYITQKLRQAKVVGQFVEFHGEGAAKLSVPDRAMLSNMAPEYGATLGYFAPDEECCRYLEMTGRPTETVQAFRNYYSAQGMLGIPKRGECDYSRIIDIDLSEVKPSVAGPKRPQDRIDLKELKISFQEQLGSTPTSTSSAKPPVAILVRRPLDTDAQSIELRDGSVVIASITSCTNTSNPGVMIAAGLLAKKAVERGLRVPAGVKTSLAPGSRVVTDYFQKTGLQFYLDQLGFHLVSYGCATCIGNSGSLDPAIEEAIAKSNLTVASVLSGNRNFEARVHPSIKANFLMSPPLVVAFALAGRVDIDLTSEPLGIDPQGKPVFLREIWPSQKEVSALLPETLDAQVYRNCYQNVYEQNSNWNAIPITEGMVCSWNPQSTYIQEPPYFQDFSLETKPVASIRSARILAILGDSVTTDHISPAGSIHLQSPAGKYLLAAGVLPAELNSYGSRRGNHQVMMRGTFANVRIRNRMVPLVEGGFTRLYPQEEVTSIFDAAMNYQSQGIPLVVFAGQEYGTGSSRDWAAKGPALLGVRVVVAQSFERIHRSNLIGMGILPCQFDEGVSAQTLGLDGSETIDLQGLESGVSPRMRLLLVIKNREAQEQRVEVTLRIDTPIEVQYLTHGGIMPYVLRGLLQGE